MKQIIIAIILLACVFVIKKLSNEEKSDSKNTDDTNTTAKDFTNIEDIRDGIIYTKDGTIHMFLKIPAISVDLLSNNEQLNLTRNLTNSLKAIDFRWKFIALSRPIDIAPIISKLNDKLYDFTDNLNEASAMQRELLKKEIMVMTNFGISGEVVERKFFVTIWNTNNDKEDLKIKAKKLIEAFNDVKIGADYTTRAETIKFINMFNQIHCYNLQIL